MTKARTLILAGVMLVGGGCGSPPDDGISVTQSEYGDRWPFTVTEGTLRCYNDPPRKHVVLDAGNGVQYGLNGAARGAGKFPDSKQIMKPERFGVHLQPFIDRGLTLCK